jgi:hypothetical protein
MVYILASSNTAPLDPVIIWSTAVITTCHILFRGKLFTFGARTDWPVVCSSCWGNAAGTFHLMCLRLLLFLCPASERRREGNAWSGEVRTEYSSRCSPGCPLRLLFLNLLRVSAAPIICWMGVFSFRQPAVTARCGGRCIAFLGALLLQVTAPSQQAAGRLLAVSPDVTELLVVMALRKTILSSICLHPDCDVAEAWQSEDFLGFFRPRQGYASQSQSYFMTGGLPPNSSSWRQAL